MQELNCHNKILKNVISIDLYTLSLKLQNHVTLGWKVTLVSLKLYSTVGYFNSKNKIMLQNVKSLHIHACIQSTNTNTSINNCTHLHKYYACV